MNESPWQPPDPAGHDRGPADPSAPSPWSPEGAAAWDRPPSLPTVPSPPSEPDPVAAPPPSPGSEPAAVAAAAPIEPERPRRRSKLVVSGVVVAVLALGLAGLFAVQRFTGEDAGGAATAEELGRDLMAAIESEDVLGMIDTMLPGERESLGQPFVEMVGELVRLGILSDDTDLSRLLGLDVELADELVQVSGTNVPDIVDVTMEATVTVTLDGATLPLGEFLEAQLPDDAVTELRGTQLTERDDLDLRLTAVQEGDRWYFSVFHTVAELAREASGGAPIPDDGVVPQGSASPEAVVDRLLDSIESLDVRGLVSLLDPAEAAALQRYAPLFLDDVESAVAEAPLDWRIDTREFRVEGDGGERTVFVDALGISGDLDGAPFRVAVADGCVSGDLDGETFEECGSSTNDELGSILGEVPALEAFAISVEDAFADLQPIGLELRERDGAWFVSPLATGSDALLAVLRALDRDELDLLVTDGRAAIDEIFGLTFPGLGLIEDEFGMGGDLALDDGFGDGDVVIPDAGTSAGWDACYDEELAVDARACFEGYLATGELDAYSVPVALMHPECGLAELTWEGGLYSLPDAEFAAALDAAVPCFWQLVDAGELEAWMLPFEVQYAECFEGRNWYTEFDDTEYNARVDTCLADE